MVQSTAALTKFVQPIAKQGRNGALSTCSCTIGWDLTFESLWSPDFEQLAADASSDALQGGHWRPLLLQAQQSLPARVLMGQRTQRRALATLSMRSLAS